MYKEIDRTFDMAEKGRNIWISFTENMKIKDNEYILIIPPSKKEFLYFSLLYLKGFCEKKERIVHIITSKEFIKKCINFLGIKFASINIMNDDDLKMIISLYDLYMFTDKLIVLSTKALTSLTAYNLVENGIVDIEEFISVGIFGNKEFAKVPLVTYEGVDLELIEFFNVKRRED